MGIQAANIDGVNDVVGASVIIIEEACENSQLLVSLCRNGKEWLSPVGWTEKQKITLLECRSQGGKTEIDIPAEFSKSLISGDKLLLTCSELDLTQEIIWETSNLQTRPVADLSPAPMGLAGGLAGGLLSRFKSIKASAADDVKTEAQLRAEEADLAAQTYRAKMEAATAAKEDAQRRALEAAKEAEAALKMEAERISEMERAAKAFEEAERLKQDGLRRLEEERREEEARIAQEARRIEEARKREEAARLETQRKAALERFGSALDVTQNEESRLQSRLLRLKTDAQALETQQSETSTSLSTLNEDMDTVQNRVEKARTAFEKTASKLDSLNAEHTQLKSKSESVSAESNVVADRVTMIESEYLTAQREAEMAMARAEEKKRLLEDIRADKDALIGELNTLTQTLETHGSLVSETTLKTHNLESKYEAAQAALNDKTSEIEALENGKIKLSDSILTSRVEIEATQQAVEDCIARQKAHKKAIEHLESGGDPENIPEADVSTRFFTDENDEDASFIESDNILSEEAETSGLLGRVRRNFLRSKEAEISIDVDDVHLDDDIDDAALTDEVQVETVATENLKKEDDKQDISSANAVTVDDVIAEAELKPAEFIRHHSKSLLTIGTILGGAAIVGGGLMAIQANKPKNLTVKSSSPVITKSASVADKVKTPIVAAPVLTPSVSTADITTEQSVIELPAIESPITTEPLSKIEPEVAAPKTSETVDAKQTTTAKSPDKPKVEKPVIKTPPKTETVKKASLKAAPAKVAPEKIPPVKTVPEKTVTPQSKVLPNYPALTKRIQGQLQTLGFYTGALNGEQTQTTTEAIKIFQELYSLPQHGRISGEFLSALTQAETQHNAAQKSAALESPTLETSNSDTAGVNTQEQNIELFDTSYSEPVLQAAVVTPAQSLAIPEQVTETDIQPSTPIVKEATAPVVTETPKAPAVEDVVVEAQRLKGAKAFYPKSAASKKYFTDVRIVVTYDIDPSGKVVNARIESNDHSGRFNSAFEREAVKAVKRQKFTAKTVNGQPVAATGNTQRIVFKGE